MSCIRLSPSAMDQLNQLAGLSDWLSSTVSTIGKAGNWLATNEKAVVNIMSAAGALRNQGASTAALVQNSYRNSLQGKAIPAGMTPDAWNRIANSDPFADNSMPPWLLPVGLGLLGLVLVMSMRRPNA